jgi:hypothetical protein
LPDETHGEGHGNFDSDTERALLTMDKLALSALLERDYDLMEAVDRHTCLIQAVTAKR